MKKMTAVQESMSLIIIVLWLLNLLHFRLLQQDPLETVFEEPPPSYSAEDILHILLNPDIATDKICKRRPINITKARLTLWI